MAFHLCKMISKFRHLILVIWMASQIEANSSSSAESEQGFAININHLLGAIHQLRELSNTIIKNNEKMDEKIEDIKTYIGKVDSQITGLQESIKDMDRKIEKLGPEIDVLNGVLGKMDVTNEKLQKLEEEIHETQINLTNSVDTQVLWTQDMDIKMKHIKGRIVNWDTNIGNIGTSIDIGNVRIEKVNSQLRNITENIGNMTTTIENTDGTFGIMVKDIEDINTKIGMIEIEFKNITENITSVSDTNIENLAAKVESMDMKIRNIVTKLGNMETKVVNTEAKVGGVDTKLVNMITKVGNMETKVGGVDTKLANLVTKIGNLETKIGNTEKKVGSMDTKIGLVKPFYAVSLIQRGGEGVDAKTKANQQWLIKIVGTEDQDVLVEIRSKVSNKCVDNENNSFDNANKVQQVTCGSGHPANTLAQTYIIVPKGLYFSLKNNRTKKCIGVSYASKENEAKLVQWPCGDIEDHLWEYNKGRLINKWSGKCLDVPLSSTANFVQLQQFTCG